MSNNLKSTRHALGLSLLEMGRALGYCGTAQTIKTQIHRYETGARQAPPWIMRLAAMYARHGIPPEFR
jgi:transcriptional regulator with XRE-family HTH domain